MAKSNKVQKQMETIIYRGYQIRRSLETGHCTIYQRGHGGVWEYLVKRRGRIMAREYIDKLIGGRLDELEDELDDVIGEE